ncbi:MAG: DUF262 domain-containing protein [Salinarimonas sp.]
MRQEIARASGAGKGDAAGFYGGAAKIWFTQAGIGWIFWGWGIVGWGVGVVGFSSTSRSLSPALYRSRHPRNDAGYLKCRYNTGAAKSFLCFSPRGTMIIKPSDPDLESVARRLLDNEIDLQPEFQRQEVWPRAKKQKLIDTILRDWAVPPVHIISGEETDEVLDGQQRLTAIRDFFLNKFPIASNIKPDTETIKDVAGKFYKDLPKHVKRKIDRYTLRVYNIQNASPQESAELFYRLNQPTALTSGEQRNALHGERRDQMKQIVKLMIDCGFSSETIGFSNSRLAYDDVIARSLVTLENNSIRQKITEGRISDAFRVEYPFSDIDFNLIRKIVSLIGESVSYRPCRMNKASLFSILVFLQRFHIDNLNLINELLQLSARKDSIDPHNELIELYIKIFNDRSASRVTDISSVVLRDFSLARITTLVSSDINFSDDEYTCIRKVQHKEYYLHESGKDLEQEVLNSSWGYVI